MSSLLNSAVFLTLLFISSSYGLKDFFQPIKFNRLHNEHIPKSLTESTNSKLFNQLSTLSAVLVSTTLLGNVMNVNADEVTKKIKKPKVLETDDGIKYIELKKGSGQYPNNGDFIIMDYTGFLNDGTVFDSTETKGRKPLSFRYGKKQMIPGIESVLGYMQAGGEVTCTIPSKLAYGEKGICLPNNQGCIVPPNETLKYVLKLRNVGAGYN